MAINFLNNGNFPDGVYLTFGTSSDLQIYHDASNSYIRDVGTGRLWIDSNGQGVSIISDGSSSTPMAHFIKDGQVDLYHNNVKTFSTNSTGITVQGDSNDITFVNSSATDHNYLNVFVPDTTVNALGVSQSNVYIPLAFEVDGVSTFNNNVTIPADNNKLRIGASNDLELYHNGTNSFIENATGNLEIINNSTDGDIIFKSDDGSGGTATYFYLDGGNTRVQFNKDARFVDSAKVMLGTSGDLQLYHDGSNSYIENATNDLYIDSNGDDLYLRADDDVVIQSQSSENAVYCTGNAGVQLYHNNSQKFQTTSSGVSVTGNCTLSSDGNLVLDPDSGIELNTFAAPGAGSEGNGIIIKLHSTTTTFGKIYYKSNFAADWSLADADSDGATRMLGVALGTSSSSDGMLLQGLIRIASHGLSAGAPLYVSTTAGEFTTTPPSGTGDYVRVVGYTIDTNIIYFNPSGTWVEVS